MQVNKVQFTSIISFVLILSKETFAQSKIIYYIDIL